MINLGSSGAHALTAVILRITAVRAWGIMKDIPIMNLFTNKHSDTF